MNDREASPAMRSLNLWQPPEPPRVALPAAPALTGGLPMAPWMRAEHASLRHYAGMFDDGLCPAFEAVAFVGAVGRLWAPRDAGRWASRLNPIALVSTDSDPAAICRRWYAALHPETREYATRIACIEARMLAEELLCTADNDPWLPSLLGRRDALASASWLTRSADVARDVARVDAAAGVVSSWLRHAAEQWPVSSPRLRAARWQEPDAWWPALAS